MEELQMKASKVSVLMPKINAGKISFRSSSVQNAAVSSWVLEILA